jgi:SAM-dependent methyltransferase
MNSIQKLEELLSTSITPWGRLSIREVYDAEHFDEQQPQLTEHLFSQKVEVLLWLNTREAQQEPTTFFDTPAAFLARKTQEWLQTQNQFLALGASSMPTLHQLYQQALVAVVETLTQSQDLEALARGLAKILASHHEGFVEFLIELERVSEIPGFIFQRAICAEYSSALQRDILGLGERLEEPVLDVGCGASAGLVVALRQLGLEAFGIDRFASAGPYIECYDWFDYPFAPNTWGTIISHLAFSHHFMHHHVRRSSDAARYAQQYLKILEALVPGGIFCYAPSLPFFEASLPVALYLVTHRPIQGQRLSASVVQRV